MKDRAVEYDKDDREEALRLIRAIHLRHDAVAARDADADALELVRQANQAKAQSREAEAARIADGRFFIAEAAAAIAEQRGLGSSAADALARDMVRCAALPDDHKHKLIVRDPVTCIPVPHAERMSRARVVYCSDVNAWLDGTGAGYRWGGAPGPAPKMNVRRDLYIAKYGSEAAADARLLEKALQDARQDAIRATEHGASAPPVERSAAPAMCTPPPGLTYWNTVLHAHIVELDQKHPPRATARQAIAYLKDLGDPRLTAPRADTPDTLQWRNNAGDLKTVSAKRVTNAMIDVRSWAARKVIPG